jgi:dienelactone hydrolase
MWRRFARVLTAATCVLTVAAGGADARGSSVARLVGRHVHARRPEHDHVPAGGSSRRRGARRRTRRGADGQRLHWRLTRSVPDLGASPAGRLRRNGQRESDSRHRCPRPYTGNLAVRRGQGRELIAAGLYLAGGRNFAVVDDPYGPPRLDDLDSGGLNGLYPAGSSFAIGSGWATRAPTRGTATFSSRTAVIAGAQATRVATRQLEVRFPSAGATLSGTLTLPPGSGRHAAVAFVTGSGPTWRAYLPDLQALLVRNGIAVLAYDKRGIGQSGGTYPGESPTSSTIDLLARDAEAAVRFLVLQPEIDPARVGLAGHSQAGWIMPLAASREAAVHFLVSFACPTVTADESDLYQDLTGQGERPQQLSNEEIDAEVLARGPSGVDPMPWIRLLHIPAVWLYGSLDMHIPTRLSVRRLEPVAHEAGRDFEIKTYPNANHALVETQTGLTSEMLRSDRFAPNLFRDVGAWLRTHLS